MRLRGTWRATQPSKPATCAERNSKDKKTATERTAKAKPSSPKAMPGRENVCERVNKPFHPSQETADEKEQIIRLTVRPNKEHEARIFSYGNQVEVLKPEWLRRQIAEKLQEILKKYSSVQEDCNVE